MPSVSKIYPCTNFEFKESHFIKYAVTKWDEEKGKYVPVMLTGRKQLWFVIEIYENLDVGFVVYDAETDTVPFYASEFKDYMDEYVDFDGARPDRIYDGWWVIWDYMRANKEVPNFRIPNELGLQMADSDKRAEFITGYLEDIRAFLHNHLKGQFDYYEKDKLKALEQAAHLLQKGDEQEAGKVIKAEYPFAPVSREERRYTPLEMMEQFFRDGFIDRYSGERLINPGMLRVLSQKLPDEFPYQAHWKTDECHMAYWDYQPTIDHIVPIALGGADAPENWATTSMRNNSAKSNFTLEQLGWSLKEKGNLKEWDGLSREFLAIV